jgi:hypothetical protein
MPILGIMASQISGHLWAPEGAYDALSTVTVGATAVLALPLQVFQTHISICRLGRSLKTVKQVVHIRLGCNLTVTQVLIILITV